MKEDVSKMQRSNITVLRLVAAFMVIGGHMGYIMGTNRPMILEDEIQTVGVKIFFLIGGYLITTSWKSEPNIFIYTVKRVSRIIPPLAVYVFLVTFVFGAFLSELSLLEYYTHPVTWRYLANIRFQTEYFLPGVFTNNPYPNAVNGSLWTLPVEVAMYVIVPIVCIILGGLRSERKAFCGAVSMVIVLCAFQIGHLLYFPEWRAVVYGTDIAQAFELIPFYFIGMLYTYPKMQKYLNLYVATLLLLLCSCIRFSLIESMIIMYVIFPYIVFSLLFAKSPSFLKRFQKFEISYGMYLYGFFIQQVVVSKILIPENGTWTFSTCFVISCLITIIFAILSSELVEKPIARVVKKVIKKRN